MVGAKTGTVIFLHGVGTGPESWSAQLRRLPVGFDGIALPVPGLRDADEVPFSLHAAARSVREELDRSHVAAAHLCGLSLGAMIAIRFALDHPTRTASLTISGAQVHPNSVLMGVQDAIMRVLPERLVAPKGMSRNTLRAVMRAVRDTDLGPELSGISAPTLVMCGSRDKPNLSAARTLAAGIPGAELQIVPGAGHEWNTRLPGEFSTRLNEFLNRQAGE